jgi:hypothetical protein
MKLKISVNKDIRNGYTNIDPVSVPGTKIRELNKIDDNECTEIILQEALDYVGRVEIDRYLDLILSKLRKSGELIIVSNDIYAITKLYQNQKITSEDFNFMVFGDLRDEREVKYGILELEELVLALQDKGLKIINRTSDVHKGKLTIKAKRI